MKNIVDKLDNLLELAGELKESMNKQNEILKRHIERITKEAERRK